MLKVEKDHRQIRITLREKKRFFTRELKIGLIIAFLFHLLALSTITIKEWLIPYQPEKVQNIAFLLSNLTVKLDSEPFEDSFPPPPLPQYYSASPQPSSLGHAFLYKVEPENSLRGFTLSKNLQDRLLETPRFLPKESFTATLKIKDLTGELFYYESTSKISEETEKWLTGLKFKPIASSFVTSGEIIFYD